MPRPSRDTAPGRYARALVSHRVSDAFLPARPDPRAAGHPAARAQRAAARAAAVRAHFAQAAAAVGGMAAPVLAHAGCDRGKLDRRQQRAVRAVHAHPLAGGRPGRLAPRRELPGAGQPPELGGYPGAAEDPEPARPVPALLPEEPADLGAVAGAGLVGAGFPVHEALLAGYPGEASRTAGQGP